MLVQYSKSRRERRVEVWGQANRWNVEARQSLAQHPIAGPQTPMAGIALTQAGLVVGLDDITLDNLASTDTTVVLALTGGLLVNFSSLNWY